MKDYETRQSIKKNKAPSWIQDCVDFWKDRVDECDLGVDFSGATTNCWRCGYLRKLQKCHIVPKSLGGKDEPENIIPLCYQCHDEMPDVHDKEEVFKWIKSNHGTIYDTFWSLESLKISGCNVEDALNKSENPDLKAKLFLERYKFHLEKTSSHFGQFAGGCKLKTTTRAWIIKKAFFDTFPEYKGENNA